MSIKEILEKIKPFYSLLLILVLSSIFFALGRLSAIQKGDEPIKIDISGVAQTGAVINASTTPTQVASSSSTTKSPSPVPTPAPSGEVIGSKSGKKYYFPWCGTVKRILPQNQVHFASITDAKAAGFTPGGNCKGLE